MDESWDQKKNAKGWTVRHFRELRKKADANKLDSMTGEAVENSSHTELEDLGHDGARWQYLSDRWGEEMRFKNQTQYESSHVKLALSAFIQRRSWSAPT